MAEWVANASPVIILARLKHVQLLRQLSDRLIIPSAVADELAAGPADDPGRLWIEGEGRAAVESSPPVPSLIAAWDLGKGESAVLATARRQTDCEIVVDDHAARQCALALGIRAVGTVGVIVRAKLRGLIPAAAPLLEDLPRQGCHIGKSVLAEALRLAGETA